MKATTAKPPPTARRARETVWGPGAAASLPVAADGFIGRTHDIEA